MLGDVPVFGDFDCQVIDKGRIILPSMTKAEKGDQVVFCVSPDGQDIFDAYPLQSFNDKIKFLDEVIITATDDNVSARARQMRKELCSSAIAQVNVDAQRRVFINTSMLLILGNNTTKFYGLGEGNRIKFFGTKDSFEKYTGRPYVKERG